VGGLTDVRQFFRFFGVSVVGVIADYTLALFLADQLSVGSLLATSLGYILGTVVSYLGHSIFSFEHTGKETVSLDGYVKYFFSTILSLLVRLIAVGLLEYVLVFPFWFTLLLAIGLSFVTSYVVSTLWVFRKV